MMSVSAAERFITDNARPFEKAVYEVLYHNCSADKALEELKKFQNNDGGFGNALEADNWNPASNPIATNDALIWLYRMGCLDEAEDITEGIIKYLRSHDSFDETEKRWLFSIESNKDYPHAVWWEKKGSGIDGFNPTVSLAAFMVCYDKRSELYEDILGQAVDYLRENNKLIGDHLKCFMLAYELLLQNKITDIIDLAELKSIIIERISEVVCPDITKYGIEYVTAPSDLFGGVYTDLVPESLVPLIKEELAVLQKLQKDDGGFDISWQWYTPYPEFETARNWWRPRVTLEKLLFTKAMYDI